MSRDRLIFWLLLLGAVVAMALIGWILAQYRDVPWSPG